MIKISYDPEHNVVIVELAGKIDPAQAEQFYPNLQKIVPRRKKGFKLLTDLTSLEVMDLEVQEVVKKTMDFFDQHEITKILRVVPDPERDIGLGIMSLFHYSKKVKILTVKSREEAWERLQDEKKNVRADNSKIKAARADRAGGDYPKDVVAG